MSLKAQIERLERDGLEAARRAAEREAARRRPPPETILDTPEEIAAGRRLRAWMRSVGIEIEDGPVSVEMPAHLIPDRDLLRRKFAGGTP